MMIGRSITMPLGSRTGLVIIVSISGSAMRESEGMREEGM